MKIVTSLSTSGDLEFKVVSVNDPDNIVVTTPKGQRLEYKNTPPDHIRVKVPIFWGLWTSKTKIDVNLKCDFVSFLGHSTDVRQYKYLRAWTCYREQFDKYPLWKCIKWEKDVYRQNSLIWNFVEDRFIQIPPDHVTDVGKFLLQTLQVEHALRAAILCADDGIDAPPPETPPPYGSPPKSQ